MSTRYYVLHETPPYRTYTVWETQRDGSYLCIAGGAVGEKATSVHTMASIGDYDCDNRAGMIYHLREIAKTNDALKAVVLDLASQIDNFR